MTTSSYQTKFVTGEEAFPHGEEAHVTQVGHIRIVHMDNPNEETIQKRISEIIQEELDGEAFEDDCPLCQDMKNGPYDVVYSGEEY